MHLYDYRFLRDCPVDTDTFRRVVDIERIRERTKNISKDYPQVASAMEKYATIMSTIDSNAIEGVAVAEDRVLGMVSERIAPMGRDEQEIFGYYDALSLINSDHEKLVLDREAVLRIYRNVMGHTLTGENGFKTRDNIIVGRDSSGKVTTVRSTVPADETEYCMGQMLAAFWEARNDSRINKLLLISCFIMDFLRIHPFIDGNGRMSRLLTTLLLYQEGYDVCRYVSMESKINASKKDYYDALAKSEDGWWENKNDYTPFISYFLDQLFLCYRELNLSLMDAPEYKRRSDGIEEFLRICIIPVSKSELRSMFPNVSETTVERVLKRLVDSGSIEKIGASRNTRYIGKRN